MKIADTALPLLACILLILAAQVAGLMGFVGAMRWCWGGAVLAGAVTVWVDLRSTPD